MDALLAAYDARINALENLLASVTLENSVQDFVFTGVNVHVRSRSGATDGTINGLGNLIVGYNEARTTKSVKSGSHNLVVGRNHNYVSYGGLVAGYQNAVSGLYASVSGGQSAEIMCSVPKPEKDGRLRCLRAPSLRNDHR